MGAQAYDPWAAYKQSKLANLLFTFEFQRRLAAKGTTTTALAAHPGLAATSLPENHLQGIQKFLLKAMNRLISQSAAMGALPLLYAATDAEAKPGHYYGPDHDTRRYPVEVRASDAAYSSPI